MGKKVRELFPELEGNVRVGHNIGKVDLPAVFITPMPNSTIKPDTINMDRSYLRTLKFDLNYHLQYNEPNLFEKYERVADILDREFQFIDYIYEDENGDMQTALIATFDREHTVDLNGLHYKFNLKLRVFYASDEWLNTPYIEDYTLVVNVREKGAE